MTAVHRSGGGVIAVHREVVFARRPGFRPLALDLYVPENPAALCVYLHGGGWRVGSRTEGPGNVKDWNPGFFERVAGMGLAVASVDYRLSGEAVFPAQSEDVAAAVDYLAEARDGFGIGSDRTLIWGVSAGGHLAALEALARAGAAPRRRIDAAVCWYPATDLDALSQDIEEAGGKPERGPDSREGALLGGALDERLEQVAAASPVNHVRPGAPPFLFLHGDADVGVPARQSFRLAEALRSAGGSAEVELVPGAGHMFPELDEPATMAVTERSVRFLLS
ncbi:alpha/beta hydrolase [Actinoplanes sp. NPDC051851]|uniref:alpha/beta hydrolase n=1 Tax=Actinoplanes sp. NPDC051851 TaxID=3154753 RepID=UPI003413AD41